MKQVDFANGKITTNIAQTALPMLVAQVLNLLYNIVDRIYIARIPGVGTEALGGVGLCFPIIIIITAFTNLYGSGGSPLFSISLGRKEQEEAGRIMNLSFFLEVVTGIILTILGLLFARPVLQLFGASESALVYSLPYIRIYLLGTIFSMIATGMNPYINAQGFPTIGMTTVVIGALTNIILDPVFIFVFGMGVRGAALATILSQMLSALFVLRFLFGSRPSVRMKLLTLAQVRDGSGRILDIVSLGSAAFVMQITNSLVQIAGNNMLARTGGDVYISVMTIVSSVRQMLDTPILAITEGASPVISYNYGAQSASRVRKAGTVMFSMAMVYTAVMWGMIVWKPAFFISVFSSDKNLLKDAVPALKLYFFAFIFQTFQYSGQTIFKALNKKKHAIFFSLFRKVVIVVPLTLMLPTVFGLGTDGVFAAEPVSNVIGGTACFLTMLATILPELKRMEFS